MPQIEIKIDNLTDPNTDVLGPLLKANASLAPYGGLKQLFVTDYQMHYLSLNKGLQKMAGSDGRLFSQAVPWLEFVVTQSGSAHLVGLD